MSGKYVKIYKFENTNKIMKIKNLLIGIAIVVLTALVVGYGIETFYPTPDSNKYCDYSRPYQEIINQTDCEAAGGKWNPQDIQCIKAPCPQGYCDMYYTCNQQYQGDMKNYSRNLFVITTIIGIILIVLGAILFNLEAVGAGIMGGGIVIIIYGAMRYWPNANNMFRFIISVIGLIIVISLGYWINREVKKESKLEKVKKIFKK